MKTTVLGYSKNGVYVEVENSFASVTFDLNTTTKECVEIDNESMSFIGSKTFYTDHGDSYQLSQSEIESLIESFNFLVD